MIVSADPGFLIVFEGKRTKVRVFRRFFYPVQAREEEIEILVYSDTGREREVTYKRADMYGLDSPLRLVAMLRLARTLRVLKVEPTTNGVQNMSFTICRSTELIGPDAEKDEWIPFDPTRLKPLDERVRAAKKRVRWKQRLRQR